MMLPSMVYLLLWLSTLSTFTTATTVPVQWPNSFPKQLAAVRRRPGLTQAEYLYHHTVVHGMKAWNAPDSGDQPLAYVQDHVFDSAYGVNTSADAIEPSYFGHQDITELYGRSENAFRTPPPNNYTATVIGPDGASFNDFSATISMFAYESFVALPKEHTCASSSNKGGANAFYFAFADNANTADNATFAAAVMNKLVSSMMVGTFYNASNHVPVPDLDARAYYGGADNPPINAVLKFWLCDDNASVLKFRAGQLALVGAVDGLGLSLENSFVMFTRPVLLYDRERDVGFDLQRAQAALRRDQYRGDVIL